MDENIPSTTASLSDLVSQLVKDLQDSREEIRGVKEEVLCVRKEMQKLNACFCSSSIKLQSLTQQNAQFLDIFLKQGQQVEVGHHTR
jgi:hypothetical protein